MSVSPHHPFRSEKATRRYLERYEVRSAAWPLPSTVRMVATSFGQTFVRLTGPEGAPPLVLLPGIGSPSHTFLQNVADLAQHYATYAVDNIHDYGRSVETRPVRDADDFSAWLDEVLTGLALGDEVNLVGLSYGGWISAQYALRFPQRVRRLVLLAPAGTVAPIPWGFIWRGILCLVPARVFMKNFMAWVATDLQSDEAGRRRLEEMTDDAFLATRSFKARKMVPPLPLSDAQLAGLRPPTLFLVGEREVIFEPRQALARLAAVAPQIETALLPGTGHDFFVTRAAEVDRRIIEFLRPSAVR